MESAKKINRRFWPLAACAALLLVLLAPPAQAADRYWVGPNPNTLWTNANNWSLTLGGAPGAGQPVDGNVFLTSTTNKTAFYDTALNPLLDTVTVDASGGSTFTLTQTANALRADFEYIGFNGKGQYVQTGGSNTNKTLYLGVNSTGNGTYTLQGGTLSTGDREVIGYGGTGLFNQTGGTNATDELSIAENIGTSGTYNLNGGHLQAKYEIIGKLGKGTFNQLTNSTNIVSGTLYLGGFKVGSDSGTGTYNMKGGYLQADSEIVGDQGKGAFTQSGGTHQIPISLILGYAATGSGTFTLQAGSLSSFNAFIGGSGIGQFTKSGGSNTTTNVLILGDGSGSSGAYTLNAGQLQAKNEALGALGTGTFTQTNGTHTVLNKLTLGDDSTGRGTYNLIKGNLQAGSETIGNDGTGTFNQTGGTHTAITLDVGPFGGGTGSGTYNLQGGTLSAGLISINNPGDTFNVKNTTTTVTGTVNNLGTVKTTNATVTWNGSFINNGAYISDPSTQTFNQNLSVSISGYLVGGSQDLFILKNDFQNFSSQDTQWNTVLSTLKFVTGADNIHNLYVPGEDNGTHGQANNFTWGSLNLTGQKLVLFDGNNANGTTALYAEAVIGATFTGLGGTLTDISNADGNPINIYYNVHLAANAYLHGLTYTIPGGGGGQLIAHSPLPPSVLLLGSGLLGLGALGWRRRKQG